MEPEKVYLYSSWASFGVGILYFIGQIVEYGLLSKGDDLGLLIIAMCLFLLGSIQNIGYLIVRRQTIVFDDED